MVLEIKEDHQMEFVKHINALKEKMKEAGIEAYIIQDGDPHQSEYVADHFKARSFLTGFNGSYGTALITLNHGDYLWTDGRYFLQAVQQLEGTGIQLQKVGVLGYPTLPQWLKKNLEDGSVIGFDGKTYSYNQFKTMKETVKKKNFTFKVDRDLIEEVWEQRPTMPKKEIFIHDMKYSGQSIEDKLKVVREKMAEASVTGYVIASLDDIAWLFNVRGKDIAFSPVAYSYALVTEEEAVLYIDEEKVNKSVREALEASQVTIKDYNKIYEDLSKEVKDLVIGVAEARVNCLLFETVNKCNEAKGIDEFTALPKACKNNVELENLKECNRKDNIAMVKFLCWLKSNVGKEKITELDVEDKLLALRGDMEHNMGASFATIAGYKEHGAIIHYKATEESSKELEPEGFILVDSGGQYLDGTTDITRTISLGALSDEMKKHYTLVLKGHIQLSRLRFKQGTKGCNIDILARMALWNEGLDYLHGTGHGLGFCLNVHEGPQSISMHLRDQELVPGMVVTNEPGYYVSGEYGIRIENDLVVVEDIKTEWGQFYRFDSVTICPYERDAIDVTLLSDEELAWLNEYHATVYSQLENGLDQEERAMLKEMTKPL